MKKYTLIVLATTFPRWANDKIPHFVKDFCLELSPGFKSVKAIVPHYKGAKTREKLNKNTTVKRFRYFFPAGYENIVYEGHAADKFSKSPVYLLKLLLFVVSQSFSLISSVFTGKKIINAHWMIPQGFIAVMAGKASRTPVVVTVHGGDVFKLRGKHMTRIKRFVLKHASAVVVNSSATEKACRKIYPGRDYPIIPMGIDLKRFKPANLPKPKAKLSVLFVGRLSQEKGVIYLLRAISEIPSKKRAGITVTLVGDGPEKENLAEFIQKNNLTDVVRMAGWIDNDKLPEFYNSSDIFVGPSIVDEQGWEEAFGLVFAEAAACGLPVIATKTGGIFDIVKDGETGFLVDDKDSSAIAGKILKMYDDRAELKRMSKAAVAHINDSFSWQNTVSEYKKILNSL